MIVANVSWNNWHLQRVNNHVAIHVTCHAMAFLELCAFAVIALTDTALFISIVTPYWLVYDVTPTRPFVSLGLMANCEVNTCTWLLEDYRINKQFPGMLSNCVFMWYWRLVPVRVCPDRQFVVTLFGDISITANDSFLPTKSRFIFCSSGYHYYWVRLTFY